MTDESRVRLGVTVTGIVQGVGYRWWTKRLAESLRVTGAVWNNPDGSVGIEVQGLETSVKAFTDALAVGPAGSLVRSVAIRSVPCVDDTGPFSVSFVREE
jgi:acylphosphatase